MQRIFSGSGTGGPSSTLSTSTPSASSAAAASFARVSGGAESRSRTRLPAASLDPSPAPRAACAVSTTRSPTRTPARCVPSAMYVTSLIGVIGPLGGRWSVHLIAEEEHPPPFVRPLGTTIGLGMPNDRAVPPPRLYPRCCDRPCRPDLRAGCARQRLPDGGDAA